MGGGGVGRWAGGAPHEPRPPHCRGGGGNPGGGTTRDRRGCQGQGAGARPLGPAGGGREGGSEGAPSAAAPVPSGSGALHIALLFCFSTACHVCVGAPCPGPPHPSLAWHDFRDHTGWMPSGHGCPLPPRRHSIAWSCARAGQVGGGSRHAGGRYRVVSKKKQTTQGGKNRARGMKKEGIPRRTRTTRVAQGEARCVEARLHVGQEVALEQLLHRALVRHPLLLTGTASQWGHEK